MFLENLDQLKNVNIGFVPALRLIFILVNCSFKAGF